jgi:hypothetical protein
MTEQIVIERSGGVWAVKHKNSFLGWTKTQQEAALVAQDLAEWLESRGRKVELLLGETRMPAPDTTAPNRAAQSL